MEMENVTRGLPEGPARRAARIAQVGARYGFGYVFGRRVLLRRQRRDVGRIGTRLGVAAGRGGVQARPGPRPLRLRLRLRAQVPPETTAAGRRQDRDAAEVGDGGAR